LDFLITDNNPLRTKLTNITPIKNGSNLSLLYS